MDFTKANALRCYGIIHEAIFHFYSTLRPRETRSSSLVVGALESIFSRWQPNAKVTDPRHRLRGNLSHPQRLLENILSHSSQGARKVAIVQCDEDPMDGNDSAERDPEDLADSIVHWEEYAVGMGSVGRACDWATMICSCGRI